MKKLTASLLIILSVIVTSCGIADDISISGTKDITKDFSISVDQTTAGTPADLSASTTINLSDVVSDAADGNIESVKINSFNYKFKDFVGANTTGRVSFALKINGEEFTSVTDVDPSTGTTYTVNEADKLAVLENILKNDSSSDLSAVGTIQSDDGAMSFKIEISFNITVTLKP